MEANPLISVVVLNWNGRRVLKDCLASLRTQTYAPLEIVLVDNGSTDGSLERVKEEFPEVRIVENRKNLGYGAGNNAGILASKGEYIMILNNDTRLDPRCVEELRKSIEKNRRLGACAAKILLGNERRLIDAAGIVVGMDGVSIGRGRLEPEDRYEREEEVFFASGCACLLRRRMLEDIGLYDEDFFAYAEDTDLGWRARLAGWRCIYAPRAIVYHLHSASSGTYSPLKAFFVERNRIYVAIKNFPLSLIVLGQIYTVWRYFWQAYGALFGKGAAGGFTREFSKVALVKILARVYLSLWREVPRLLRKRSEVERKRRISNREIYDLIRRFGISAREIALKG